MVAQALHWFNQEKLARFKIVQKVVIAPLQIMEGTFAGYKRSSPGRAGKNVSW
jgi:hypothetical protein